MRLVFLSAVEGRNPALVEFAVKAHQDGQIPPDCYVVDADAVEANARLLSDTAAEVGIELLQIAKQIGRNPVLMERVAKWIPQAAAIDYREVMAVAACPSVSLGNVGHLVQIPTRMLRKVLAQKTRFVTVFDWSNLEAVAAAAADLGIEQQVLLKIQSDPGDLYPGQEGGFAVAELPLVLEKAAALSNVEIVGLTGFPCFLFSAQSGAPEPTKTLQAILEGAKLMTDPVLDLPSHTSVSTIPLIAELGGQIGEPGHALTGTTPEHAVNRNAAETPAILYVSEIAHNGKVPAIFGGGFYGRGHAENVSGFGRDGVRWQAKLVDAPAENIDYYRALTDIRSAHGGEYRPQVGETTILSFRTQIFVTRSLLAVVSGLSAGTPQIEGIFDSLGTQVKGAQTW